MAVHFSDAARSSGSISPPHTRSVAKTTKSGADQPDMTRIRAAAQPSHDTATVIK
ncbi:hypothetical protein [Bifidobacterium aerophilum]|uniref:hypothetical protein n=1 Tax=Bifidobacterium aerophilum TaxID=1798155 RepID=UPI0013D82AD5|nr:hypothetical protein [Bifidobacterium aerophilum]